VNIFHFIHCSIARTCYDRFVLSSALENPAMTATLRPSIALFTTFLLAAAVLVGVAASPLVHVAAHIVI
jgi:hypothetical protein